MKVIIAGSRDIENHSLVFAILDDAHKKLSKSKMPITEVVSGAARGIDSIGADWAKSKLIPVSSFPAKWGEYGKRAGPIRNQEMGDYADALIAIWDGESSGTKNMIDIMKKLNKPHHVFILSDEMMGIDK